MYQYAMVKRYYFMSDGEEKYVQAEILQDPDKAYGNPPFLAGLWSVNLETGEELVFHQDDCTYGGGPDPRIYLAENYEPDEFGYQSHRLEEYYTNLINLVLETDEV